MTLGPCCISSAVPPTGSDSCRSELFYIGGSAVPEASEPTNDVVSETQTLSESVLSVSSAWGGTRGRAHIEYSVSLSDPARPKSYFCPFEVLKPKYHHRVSYRGLKVFPSPRISIASWSSSCVAQSSSTHNQYPVIT